MPLHRHRKKDIHALNFDVTVNSLQRAVDR